MICVVNQMKNKLRIAVVIVGVLICAVTVGNFINASTIQDNTKSMTFVYEVQDDGSLKLIEEQEHMPMTAIDIIPNICAGMIMILWAVFLYPIKRGEIDNASD